MATGPQHYRIAEQLLDVLNKKMERGEPIATHDLQAYLALAQVHSTLALAAATIAGSNAEWREALS